MALTPRQQRFVQEYVVDLNGTQAATRAGYSSRSAKAQATRLLTYAAVRAAVDAALEEKKRASEISAEYVLGRIREVLERCSQHAPVLDKNGDPVMVETPDGEMAPAYTFDAAGAAKAAELLGKHIGLFPNKVQWSGTLAVTNKDAVPCPQSYEEWLEYQRTQQAQPATAPIALPPPEQVNGQ